jgi:hypothetical protein
MGMAWMDAYKRGEPWALKAVPVARSTGLYLMLAPIFGTSSLGPFLGASWSGLALTVGGEVATQAGYPGVGAAVGFVSLGRSGYGLFKEVRSALSWSRMYPWRPMTSYIAIQSIGSVGSGLVNAPLRGLQVWDAFAALGGTASVEGMRGLQIRAPITCIACSIDIFAPYIYDTQSAVSQAVINSPLGAFDPSLSVNWGPGPIAWDPTFQ